MNVREFHSTEEFKNHLIERNLIPLKCIRIQLRHREGGSHYAYIFYVTYHDVWFTDSPTDFSGYGGSFKRTLDNLVARLVQMGMKIKEYIMDYELYNDLRTVMYYLYRKEED